MIISVLIKKSEITYISKYLQLLTLSCFNTAQVISLPVEALLVPISAWLEGLWQTGQQHSDLRAAYELPLRREKT